MMKKGALIFALVWAVIGSVYAGAAKDKGATPQVYTIATDTTFAPFEFQDANRQYVGVDVDLLAAIAADQGFAYNLKPLGF
ncbi:MAG: transporter substrate-binding domain-containing protein, partial [Treponema sp.]|nr:transporter substrate-binding domain-containing protein [Treponema sp.]